MNFPLLPRFLVDELPEITPEQLQARGIRLLMLDFDNTIVPYTTNAPTEKMEAWLSAMAASQIKICVVSNSKRDRVKIFCGGRNMDCITHAKKPFSKGIRECLKKYNLPPSACAIAGDQIFTDTLGGNMAGLTTILVKPINNHNPLLRARHMAEKPFIFLARKRRMTK